MCRRLITLNKCVDLRLEPRRSKRRGDDFEEDFCAISPNWTFDRQTRRWRRFDSSVDMHCLSDSPTEPQDVSLPDFCNHHDICSIHSSCSTDSEGRDGPHKTNPVTTAGTTDDQETSRSSSRCSSSTNKTPSLDTSLSRPPSPGGSGEASSTMSMEAESCFSDKSPRKKCTILLRKMEKLKLRGTTGLLPSGQWERSSSRVHHVISRPVLFQEDKMDRLPCPSSSSSSSSSHSESSSAVSTPSPVARVRSKCKRTNSGAGFSGGTTRDNQSHTGSETCGHQINNSSHDNMVFQIPDGHKPGTFPTSLAHKHHIIDDTSFNWRTGSFHGYRGQNSCRHGTSSLATGVGDLPSPSSCDAGVPSPLVLLDHRLSIYDNVPDNQRLSESEGGSGSSSSDTERMGEESEVNRLLDDEDVFSALDNVLERISNLQQLVNTWSENLSEDDSQKCSSPPSSEDSPTRGSSATSPCPSSPSHIHLEVQHPEEEEAAESCDKVSANGAEPKPRPAKPRSSRVNQQLHWSSQQNLPSLPTGPGLENQSVSQFALLQKLSLLKLTALMDKYSPSSKQGWSWTVPKPLRKAEVVEVKGRRVFGVPLLLNVQQTGEALPPSILRALVYLRTQCLDQVGLFRKSGLKSRIQYLRELVETDPDGVSYERQSAFDVADMVKQYFRDLPEPIFTSKLCESFLHIYQYFPKDQQLLAVQAAILLLPDENREALRTLFFFLRDVVACVDENQMTPTNIAVCLAPSLFHLNTVKRDTKAARSSHRKYSLGRPDQRDLSENLAATQGLANMITEAQRLFQLPEFWPGQCVSAAACPADSKDGGLCSQSLTQTGATEVDQEERRSKLQKSTQQLLKEARERSRGWESHPAAEPVDLAFKKMGDGCPLWMWRGSVEVDAPQEELLQRLLREQELWVGNLRQAAVVETLATNAEVYRYVLGSQGHDLHLRPPQEHLLLRTWQADPSSGPLYLSSVSTEHPQVPVEGIRVHVHTCLYLLEATGARKTQLTHLCRTDTRDRSLEWHCKVSGHLLASGLLAIRDSFRPGYRETKI